MSHAWWTDDGFGCLTLILVTTWLQDMIAEESEESEEESSDEEDSDDQVESDEDEEDEEEGYDGSSADESDESLGSDIGTLPASVSSSRGGKQKEDLAMCEKIWKVRHCCRY